MSWTILNAATVIHTLEETTVVAPAVDEILIYDNSLSENRKVLLANVLGDGTVTTAKLVEGSVTAAKLGSDVGKCRAWVNFNGTGTVAINAALNVSSITDNGVGDYTVNFTSSLSDANYSVSGMQKPEYNIGFLTITSLTSSGVRLARQTYVIEMQDSTIVCVSVFR